MIDRPPPLTNLERQQRKIERERASGLIRVSVTIPEERKEELKYIVAMWVDEKSKSRRPNRTNLVPPIGRKSYKSFLAGCQNWRCAYCHCVLTYQTTSLDHVNPVANGGMDELDNLVAACVSCNKYRGKMNAYRFFLVRQAGLREGWWRIDGRPNKERLQITIDDVSHKDISFDPNLWPEWPRQPNRKERIREDRIAARNALIASASPTPHTQPSHRE